MVPFEETGGGAAMSIYMEMAFHKGFLKKLNAIAEIFAAYGIYEDLEDLALSEQLAVIAEAFAEFGRYKDLEDLAFSPSGIEPIGYARKLCRRSSVLEMLFGASKRNRIRQYALRYVPCAHAACGVMISKKGRLVRRKR